MTAKRAASGGDWMSLWVKSWEVAWAAPMVVGYRLSRMAWGGWPPSGRDRREYRRMGQEKADAAVEMWTALALAWPATAAATMQRALVPVHRRVVANNRRLSRG